MGRHRLRQRGIDPLEQLSGVERLYQERDGATPQRLLSNVVVIMGGNEEHGHIWRLLPDAPLQLDPVYSRQLHVRDNTGGACDASRIEECFCGRIYLGLVPGRFQDTLNRFSNTTIVVDRCDDRFRLRHHSLRSDDKDRNERPATIGLFRRWR